MKATDMIKSIAFTANLSSDDVKVVTQYKNQNPDVFLADNFKGCGPIASCVPAAIAPAILDSQSYLAVYNEKNLVSPDGQSVLLPDHVIEFTDNSHVLLYKFN